MIVLEIFYNISVFWNPKNLRSVIYHSVKLKVAEETGLQACFIEKNGKSVEGQILDDIGSFLYQNARNFMEKLKRIDLGMKHVLGAQSFSRAQKWWPKVIILLYRNFWFLYQKLTKISFSTFYRWLFNKPLQKLRARLKKWAQKVKKGFFPIFYFTKFCDFYTIR